MSAGAISGASGLGTREIGNQFAELSSAEFIKILTTELANQDPLEPNDTNAILEQLSSLRNIESQTALQDQLEKLVNQNSLASSANLIGKGVEGLTRDNDDVAGIVTGIRVENGAAMLELDTGHTLPVDRVTKIVDVNVTF